VPSIVVHCWANLQCVHGLCCYKPNSITLASSELAPNMFGAISELASVMEFGFITTQPEREIQRVLVLAMPGFTCG